MAGEPIKKIGIESIVILIDAALTLLGKANSLRDIAKQNKELTPEEEAALDKKLQDAFASSRWQPTGR